MQVTLLPFAQLGVDGEERRTYIPDLARETCTLQAKLFGGYLHRSATPARATCNSEGGAIKPEHICLAGYAPHSLGDFSLDGGLEAIRGSSEKAVLECLYSERTSSFRPRVASSWTACCWYPAARVLVCCSRNKTLLTFATLQVSFLPTRVLGERSEYYA